MQGVVKQRVNWNFIRQEITKKKLDPVGSTVRYEVMNYKMTPVGTSWYWVSIWQCWLILGYPSCLKFKV